MAAPSFQLLRPKPRRSGPNLDAIPDSTLILTQPSAHLLGCTCKLHPESDHFTPSPLLPPWTSLPPSLTSPGLFQSLLGLPIAACAPFQTLSQPKVLLCSSATSAPISLRAEALQGTTRSGWSAPLPVVCLTLSLGHPPPALLFLLFLKYQTCSNLRAFALVVPSSWNSLPLDQLVNHSPPPVCIHKVLSGHSHDCPLMYCLCCFCTWQQTGKVVRHQRVHKAWNIHSLALYRKVSPLPALAICRAHSFTSLCLYPIIPLLHPSQPPSYPPSLSVLFFFIAISPQITLDVHSFTYFIVCLSAATRCHSR